MLQTFFFKTALASMLVVCTMGFSSCNSDGGEPETPPTPESAIVGKWDVSSTKARAAGDTKYGSFEFTADGKYIITQPAVATNGDKYMLVIFGDYDAIGGESNELTLDLKEFGTIKISITESTASITIDGVIYVAVKADKVESTDRTKLLCATWKVDKRYNSYTDSDGEKHESTTLGNDETITFTDNGTYLIPYYDDLTKEPLTMCGTWKWITSDIIEVTTTHIGISDPPSGPGEEPKEPEITIETAIDTATVTELTDSKLTMEATSVNDYGTEDHSIMWLYR